MGRHDLTNAQWAKLEPLLPVGSKPGRPPVRTKRQLIDGIRWRTRAGAPWRDVPERYGPWETVYGLFRRWQRDGTWHRIFEQLQARADVRGRPSPSRVSDHRSVAGISVSRVGSACHASTGVRPFSAVGRCSVFHQFTHASTSAVKSRKDNTGAPDRLARREGAGVRNNTPGCPSASASARSAAPARSVKAPAGAVTLLGVYVPDGASGHGGPPVRACVQAVVGQPTAPVISSQMAKRWRISAR
ncbi:transposase [Streptomyces sp. NPDC058092]|uniref:transposase n=1 Tax=Streptomyces sp. NPDC058092 TaxID=3346336 RepID=UPI0036DFE9F9